MDWIRENMKWFYLVKYFLPVLIIITVGINCIDRNKIERFDSLMPGKYEGIIRHIDLNKKILLIRLKQKKTVCVKFNDSTLVLRNEKLMQVSQLHLWQNIEVEMTGSGNQTELNTIKVKE